jgi:hypothetical protein
MDAVELSNKDKRDLLVDIGGAVFVHVDVGAEIRDAPAALLGVHGSGQKETSEEYPEQFPGGRRLPGGTRHG